MTKKGVYEYPNHTLLKKNRFLKLQQQKGRCEVCKEKAHKIHHKDEDKSNHDMDNLAVVCNRCHGVLHTCQPRKTTIFIRQYGMTLKEMSQKFGGTTQFIYRMHRQGNLKEFIKKNTF